MRTALRTQQVIAHESGVADTVDPAVEDEQVRQLAQVKAGRDANEVAGCLAALEKAAQTEGADLMEPVLGAVRAYCSLGEICGVLRGVFGEYRGRAW
nr:methylmalonyl-CoA mutase family protein [Candidatus Electrothrix aestuarii]